MADQKEQKLKTRQVLFVECINQNVFRLSRLEGVCALRTVCWKLDDGDIKNRSLFAVGI